MQSEGRRKSTLVQGLTWILDLVLGCRLGLLKESTSRRVFQASAWKTFSLLPFFVQPLRACLVRCLFLVFSRVDWLAARPSGYLAPGAYDGCTANVVLANAEKMICVNLGDSVGAYPRFARNILHVLCFITGFGCEHLSRWVLVTAFNQTIQSRAKHGGLKGTTEAQVLLPKCSNWTTSVCFNTCFRARYAFLVGLRGPNHMGIAKKGGVFVASAGSWGYAGKWNALSQRTLWVGRNKRFASTSCV